MKFAKILVYAFFFILVSVGVSTYQHYGISYDEFSGHELGTLNYNYITQGDEQIFSYHDKDYAPIYEIFIIALENITGVSNGTTEQMFYLRHFVIFLTFCLGVFFFYLLCKFSFNSRWMALLGCLMLVVCPRIYGHAFFNSKDIPFMTFMIMSAYSGLRFLKAPSVIRAFVHAFFCALAVDTRIAGVLMPGITLMMYGAQTIVLSQNRSWKSFFAIVCYVLFSFLLIVLMWPMLWQNPVEKFIQFFQSAAHYQHPFYEFYMGQWLKPIDHELPWHYLPVWMMVTIPIIVLVLFFLGISSFLISLKRGLSAITQQPVMVMSLLWFFIPLTIVTITKPTIYDGWRHFYFVYPAMVMIAIYALSCLYAHKRIFVAVLFLLIINLSFTLTKMVGLHPYEHVYFNQLAGKDLQSSLKDFELDLWGVEYRKPIEYILNNDLGKDISLYSPNVFAPLNLLLIPAQQERGVHFVHDPHLAKYWILDYYAMKSRQNELELSRKLFMLSIDGVDVIGVYERSRF